jgi:hypothetical protein
MDEEVASFPTNSRGLYVPGPGAFITDPMTALPPDPKPNLGASLLSTKLD